MKHPRSASRYPLKGAIPVVRQSRPDGISRLDLLIRRGLLFGAMEH